jgi:hypothetical protein
MPSSRNPEAFMASVGSLETSVVGRRRSRRACSGLVVIAVLVAALLSGCQKKTEPAPANSGRAADTVFESGLTIVLEDNKDPDPLKAALDKHSEQDHCRWQNLTSADRKIHLKSWPFMEEPKDFTVPAFGLSEWYSLDKAKASKDYPYEISPSLSGNATSTRPAIVVGD